jgi:hypothetical protein
MHCVRVVGNKMVNGHEVDISSINYHSGCERLKIGTVIMFLLREQATSAPNSLRNVNGTYLVNHHSKLYPSNDYRILNGPYRMFAINETKNAVLNHTELAALIIKIQTLKNADIQAGRYSTDITPAEGAAIKQTL